MHFNASAKDKFQISEFTSFVHDKLLLEKYVVSKSDKQEFF